MVPERDIRTDITPWEGYPSVGLGGLGFRVSAA